MKLLRRTPPVVLEKTVANTPSSVEALRLLRITFFEVFGESCSVDGITSVASQFPKGVTVGSWLIVAVCSKFSEETVSIDKESTANLSK
jgi:hypothetical protein